MAKYNSTKIGIILVNWNRGHDTLKCIESILLSDCSNYAIICVDNCSSDGSVLYIETNLLKNNWPFKIIEERDLGQFSADAAIPGAIYILKNNKNEGYAGGNNRGWKLASAIGCNIVWILNNDTIIESTSIAKLSTFGNFKDTIVGTAIIDYDGEGKQPSGGIINPFTFRIGLFENNYFCGRDNRVKESSLNYISGASMLLPMEALSQSTGFDESYFLYCEEGDLCLRLRRLGYKIRICPEVTVRHKGSLTTGRGSALVEYYMTRNSFYMFERHFPLYLPYVLLTQITYRTIAILIKQRVNKIKLLHALYRGLMDYLKRLHGKT
jgi:GT2 family glycosyltransferase